MAAPGDGRRSQRDVTGRDQPFDAAQSMRDLLAFQERILLQNQSASMSGAPVQSTGGTPVDFRRTMPGGDDPTQMISGLEGVLKSNAAVAQEVSNVASEMKVLNDRQRTMLGQSVSQTSPQTPMDQSALVDAFKTAIDESAKSVKQPLPPLTGMTYEATSDWLPTPPSAQGPSRRTSPASGSPQTLPDRPGLPESNPGEEEKPPTPQEAFAQARSVSSLRAMLGEKVAAKVSQANPNPEGLVQDPLGNYRYPTGLEETQGEYGDLASGASLAAMARRSRVLGAVNGAGGALAGGASMGEAGLGLIGGTGAKALGVAGLALAGVQTVGNFAEEQRAINNEYIAMRGGDQSDALGERFKSKMFQLSQFGTMDGAMADELYKGVAATGMSGDNRDNAQDFAIENYKNLGMSIEDSLSIIDKAAANNQESLLGLATALENVTVAARDAGVNTEEARKDFERNWESYSKVFNGPVATELAGAVSTAKAGLGSDFEDLNATDLLTQENLRIAGRDNGMTGNQMAALQYEPGGQEKLLTMVSDSLDKGIASSLPDEAKAAILEASRNKEDPTKPFSEAEMSDLKGTLLNMPGVPEQDVLARILEQYNIPGLTPEDSLDFYIRQLGGEFRPEKALAESTAAASATKTLGEYKSPEELSGMDGLRRSAYKMSIAGTDEWQDIEEGLADGEVGRSFADDALLTGRVGGISQMLAGKDANYGVQKVAVQTADGERVVDLQEAMTYFRDQVDRGDIEVVEGEGAGQTLAEATNSKGDSSVEVTSAEDEEAIGVGESLADFEKRKSAATEKSQQGRVMIVPSPELAKYFEFRPSGPVEVDPSVARNPAAAETTPEGRLSSWQNWGS